MIYPVRKPCHLWQRYYKYNFNTLKKKRGQITVFSNGVYKKIITVIFIILFLALFAPAQSAPITTNAQGEECLSVARNFLAGYGIKVDRKIPVEVCSLSVFQGHHTLISGGTGDDIGGYYQAFAPESIWIITGYSREYAVGILAHEFAHAWQSTEAPARQNKMPKEGFATWCQYKMLMSLGAKSMANALFSLSDPDYSQGLRIYLDVEAKSGTSGVINYARTAI